MNILSALAGFATGSRPGPSLQEGSSGETPFAALLARLGGEAAPEAEAPLRAALFEEAEAALADPEISDQELADAFAPLLAALQGDTSAGGAPLVQRLAEMLEALRAGQELPPEALGGDIAPNGEAEPGIRAELTRLLGELSGRAGQDTRPGAPVLRNDPAETRVQAGRQAEAQSPAPTLAASSPDAAQDGTDAQPASAATPPDAAQDGTDPQPAGHRPDPRAALAVSAEPRAAPTISTEAAVAPQAAAPAAVSAAQPAQPPQPSQPLARPPLPDSGQILTQLRAHVDEGGTLRVALRPEGLGRVEISLVPGDDGQLSVTVKADQASVLGSLRADREGLLTLLRDAGHQIDARALSFGDLEGGGAETGRQPGQQTQHSRETGVPGWVAPEISETSDTDTSPQVTPASGAVDITV